MVTWAVVVTAWLAGNLLGAALVVQDKRAARHGARRRPEATFHFLALLGCWPGMVLAMRSVRHKTRKRSFQVRFAAAALVGVAAWAFLLWP